MSCKWALVVLVVINCAGKQVSAPAQTDDKYQHFISQVYDGVPASVAASVVAELKRRYQPILTDLEVDTLPPISVEIWGNGENFLSAMEKNIGQRYPGSTGYVKYEGICLLNRGDVPHTAVHEFAHVVSLHVNRRIGNNPRWLWEAVALYEAGDFVDPKTLPYMVSGNYPTLAELNANFNSDQKIYAVGYTLTEFIRHDWGRRQWIDLIKANGQIESVLEISVGEFESRWYEFVKENYLNTL